MASTPMPCGSLYASALTLLRFMEKETSVKIFLGKKYRQHAASDLKGSRVWKTELKRPPYLLSGPNAAAACAIVLLYFIVRYS